MNEWLEELLDIDLEENRAYSLVGGHYVYEDGILRQENVLSESQRQTEQAFGFKWAKRETYESKSMRERTRDWMIERYCDGEPSLISELIPAGVGLLDAGCGSGVSSMAFLGEHINRIRYLGVDISQAIDVARRRFEQEGLVGSFLQADFTNLPFDDSVFDVVLAEGTLHHTDSTSEALRALVSLLKPRGRILFYVYRKKGPIREFTDDYVRGQLADLSNEEAWETLRPLTKLGKALGEMNVEVQVPEEIPFLGIPAGRINLQRFFYWHVIKLFHGPDLNLEEMNHINFDWFRPRNAHRHDEGEVRGWCEGYGLEIEHMDVQRSGITVVAHKLR